MNVRPDKSIVRTTPDRAAAFSLLELMIAIVILGLGLVMVAAMFPVAWERARNLSEQSISQTVVYTAQSQVESALRVTDRSLNHNNLAGDLVLIPPIGAIMAPSDTRVHALNMSNMRVVLATGQTNPLVDEDPWRAERQLDYNAYVWDPDVFEQYLGPDFVNQTFHAARIAFHERVYPPMRARNSLDFTMPDTQWDQTLARRTFAWSILYRMQDFGAPLPPTETPPPIMQPWLPAAVTQAREAVNNTRSIDFYFVTLRRPSPTNRYAQQQSTAATVPNPYVFTRPPQSVTPAALEPAQDLLFPVPWRVQLQFPINIVTAGNGTGIPTEVEVPACDNGCTGTVVNEPARRMLVGMFPVGAQFVDEVSGQVFRVTRRRFGPNGDTKAFLTLDREVVMEDLDFPGLPKTPYYPPCENCNPLAAIDPQLDPEEFIRTVWVYPPPIENRTEPMPSPVSFSGPQPVISIETRNLSFTPQQLVQ